MMDNWLGIIALNVDAEEGADPEDIAGDVFERIKDLKTPYVVLHRIDADGEATESLIVDLIDGSVIPTTYP